jgi:hypothetical protein
VARGESLAQLTDIGNMEVRAFVPLKHLPRTVVGEPISVFATDAVYEGRIRALVPTGDVRSQTKHVLICLLRPAIAGPSASWSVSRSRFERVPRQLLYPGMPWYFGIMVLSSSASTRRMLRSE